MKSILYITLLCIINSCDAIVSCLDESNSKVQSWTIFKLPQSTTYYYYDTNQKILQQSPYSLNDTSNGALTNTIQQLWSSLSNINYVLYNDEPPSNPPYNFSVAHSKGFWMWDDKSAIIITHSIPKFPLGPQESSEYIGLLSNAWVYGQVVSCLTVTSQEIEAMISYLEITNPLVYETTVSSLPTEDKQITIKGENQNNIPCNSYLLENTYLWFVKSPSTQIDIWSSCIAPYFDSSMQVESWLHGANPDGPTCSTYDIVDIQALEFGESEISNYDDHSKWGIGESPLVCFGDLNRMQSQMIRGGGVYCWKDQELWQIMNNIIQSTDSC